MEVEVPIQNANNNYTKTNNYVTKKTNNNNNNNNNNDQKANNNDPNSKSALALIEVRQKFLEYADKNADKVNERDRHKLATDDWYLKRYLLARNRKVKDTLKMLEKTMDWRNEFGIHISEDAMFPQEFYKIGALFPYENDKNGNMVLYLRIKYHRKVVEMVEVEKHFLVHTFEKIDRLTNGSGLVIVFDCQGANYANCDIEFLQFLISCATEHAPVGLQYIIVYKLPWFLNAFWSLVKKLLPSYLANRVKFCDENTVQELIHPENLPDFMGGVCKRNYRWIPPGCPSIFKLANAHGITDAEISKILPQFQQFLDEADEIMTQKSYEDPPDAIAKYINNPDTAPTLLSDLALINIGLGKPGSQQEQISSDTSSIRAVKAVSGINNTSIIRIFPNKFVEFTYDAYNDIFQSSLTFLNPSKTKYLAFKMMSNRPSSYSVKPARGILAPDASITINIVLLNEHKTNDKFLILAQPLEDEVEHITKAQFNSIWSSNDSKCASIKFTSYVRKINHYHNNSTTNLKSISTIKSPHIQELAQTCNSLNRRQSFFFIINILFFLFILVINMNLFTQGSRT